MEKIRNIRIIEEAENFVITWGRTYCGKTLDEVPNSYLRYMAENFDGHKALLADTHLNWREEHGVFI